MLTLLLATRNSHKTEEIRALLGNYFRIQNLFDFPEAPEVVENAVTFAGNARLKAQVLAQWLRRSSERARTDYVLADDSGLEVDALDGAPGVRSARFAAEPGHTENAPDPENNSKLLRLLTGVPEAKRTARFRCVLALAVMLPDASRGGELAIHLFEGTC